MVQSKRKGQQSIAFQKPPYLIGWSSVAGKKEGEGPLGKYFDYIDNDPTVGTDSWEAAESNMQRLAAEMAIDRAGLKPEDMNYIIAGDLLGQLIATSFGIMSLDIPMFGVYGACSTMGESMALGAMLVEGGYADKLVALTSSHFASAEKQFRFPLGYGNQRPLSSTWTVTGSGAVVIGREKGKFNIRITGITTGKIRDYGVKDSMNMGACMAPAAADVIYQNLEDFGVEADYYDRIITGDLGYIGKDILGDMMEAKGHDIRAVHMDCGVEIYDKENQDTHAGGSGCACSAITLTGLVTKKMQAGEWKRVLFVPTGALLSPTSFNEGNSVPGIAHGVMLEVID
ncbi:stage V sporulation protein AD [Anaerolentibacter hominis]|uniref:stage V sporulation protein AD n=1 Tax=Anaerolentibacter hominis TaxID=3079009 RepID=UPI0031B857FA